MKLSDKLALIDDDDVDDDTERHDAPVAPAPTIRKPASKKRSPRSRSGPTWTEQKKKVRALVLEALAPKLADLAEDELSDEVRKALDDILSREDVSISPIERKQFVNEVISDTLGFGPLDALLVDPTITEVMCNAFDEIWVEREGRIEQTDVSFTDDDQYRQVIDRIVSAVGRRVDEGSPMVDARLSDGSRVNVIVPPLALKGAVLTIRKFAADPYTVHDLINFGTFTIDLATVIEACVRGKMNVLVSGGTGTGKTTNLNVLSSFIPDGERVITIEDAAELQLQQPHVINLEARPPNAEGRGEVRIRDLVRNALRMRPDRIIVGEVRGAEALDMLQAMNTGHEGSMTTVHCNGPRDALSRLETMVLMAGYELPVRAIREQVASAIDVIVHLDRLPDGRRVVTSVAEIQGMEGDTILMQEIFHYRNLPSEPGEKLKGELVPTGLRPRFADTLAEQSIELPAAAFKAPPEVRRTENGSRGRRGRVSEKDIIERERRR